MLFARCGCSDLGGTGSGGLTATGSCRLFVGGAAGALTPQFTRDQSRRRPRTRLSLRQAKATAQARPALRLPFVHCGSDGGCVKTLPCGRKR